MTIFNDINSMHEKFKVHDWVNKAEVQDLNNLLQFRLKMLLEECDETKEAIKQNNPEEIVDGLIDIIVIAAGTLDLFKVNAQKAWDEVHNANLEKKVGVKKERPNPLGLPDLIKPNNWKAPSHKDNYGLLIKIKKEKK
jgi:predicted HAD superfamily Cof-like phosphohydrolase